MEQSGHNELNNTGQVFEDLCNQAWAILPTDPERADEIAGRLLLEPRLGELRVFQHALPYRPLLSLRTNLGPAHEASMHFLLAHSPDDYV